MFPRATLKGKKPPSASIIVQKYLRPAALGAGVIPTEWKESLRLSQPSAYEIKIFLPTDLGSAVEYTWSQRDNAPIHVHHAMAEMKPITRSLIAGVATFAAFYYVYWVPCAIILEMVHGRFRWMWIIRLLGSLVGAAGVAKYAWRHKSMAPRGLVSCMILGGVVAGGVGFSAGWFGPMIADPGSQGPLIAIVTGPLGFLVGTIGGALYWSWWRSRKKRVSGGTGVF